MTGRCSRFRPIKNKKPSKRKFLIYESQHFRFIFHFGIFESDSYRAAVSFVVSLSVNKFPLLSNMTWWSDCYASQTNSVPSLKWSLLWNISLVGGHKCLMQTFTFLNNYDLMLTKVVFPEYWRDCVIRFNEGTQSGLVLPLALFSFNTLWFSLSWHTPFLTSNQFNGR